MTIHMKFKQRVLLAANTSWYLYNFRLPLLRELLAHGCEVLILAPADLYVEKLQHYNIRHINISIARSGLNPFDDTGLLSQYITAYKRLRPDIVQHFTVKPVTYGTIAARLCHIKFIFNMISGLGYVFTGTGFKKLWIQKIVRMLYKRSMDYSHHVFFQNKDDRDYFLRHDLVDENKITVLPGTGVDTCKFKRVNTKERKSVTFVLAARMLWDKGIKEFVDAAYLLNKKHKDINFWLLGPVDRQNPSGIPPEHLNVWNKEGIVKYLGTTDNVRSYLERADVIVLPSYREGIPLSLLEGAAMRMPIITTDAPGCREVVENGKNGYVVPIKDSDKLAAAMEQFILNPKFIGQMGKESRKMAVSRFDSRKIVKEILKFYPL